MFDSLNFFIQIFRAYARKARATGNKGYFSIFIVTVIFIVVCNKKSTIFYVVEYLDALPFFAVVGSYN